MRVRVGGRGRTRTQACCPMSIFVALALDEVKTRPDLHGLSNANDEDEPCKLSSSFSPLLPRPSLPDEDRAVSAFLIVWFILDISAPRSTSCTQPLAQSMKLPSCSQCLCIRNDVGDHVVSSDSRLLCPSLPIIQSNPSQRGEH